MSKKIDMARISPARAASGSRTTNPASIAVQRERSEISNRRPRQSASDSRGAWRMAQTLNFFLILVGCSRVRSILLV
jgi:hypothetical protein